MPLPLHISIPPVSPTRPARSLGRAPGWGWCQVHPGGRAFLAPDAPARPVPNLGAPPPDPRGAFFGCGPVGVARAVPRAPEAGLRPASPAHPDSCGCGPVRAWQAWAQGRSPVPQRHGELRDRPPLARSRRSRSRRTRLGGLGAEPSGRGRVGAAGARDPGRVRLRRLAA
jgi:hypothetical protein